MKRYLLVLLLFVVFLGCNGEKFDCSQVCVGDGVAESASVCSDDLIREPKCEAPELIRLPVVGELVSVESHGETRTSVVLSVSRRSFSVAGPPNEGELGSGVWGESDRALLGIVQSNDHQASECSMRKVKHE
jgi:hypothetical protein